MLYNYCSLSIPHPCLLAPFCRLHYISWLSTSFSPLVTVNSLQSICRLLLLRSDRHSLFIAVDLTVCTCCCLLVTAYSLLWICCCWLSFTFRSLLAPSNSSLMVDSCLFLAVHLPLSMLSLLIVSLLSTGFLSRSVLNSVWFLPQFPAFYVLNFILQCLSSAFLVLLPAR